ncbi:hypothetical protein CTI12_AA345260 [Artemisia annua]|uniref:Acid phosphatase 1 n=1 Tax=Artemisia annua TaxID=35608 RepID=A0A2U1MT12_ARTAN|nr:hypothetical protein CTI12_AA345260 [Artemisia annua]
MAHLAELAVVANSNMMREQLLCLVAETDGGGECRQRWSVEASRWLADDDCRQWWSVMTVDIDGGVVIDHHQSPESDSGYCESWKFSVEVNDAGTWTRVPEKCVEFVEEYMNGERYRMDSEVIASHALKFAKSVGVRNDGKDVWVFDIDETLLSNLPYYVDHGYGWKFSVEVNDAGTWTRVPEKCVEFVEEYMNGERYRMDSEVIASNALKFAKSVGVRNDGKDVWVFDIDETLLSNLPYYVDHGYG